MLRLEDHRPFAVRMADKKLFDYAFPDAFLTLFAKSVGLMPYTEMLFRNIYEPIRPNRFCDFETLMQKRSPTFRHVEQRRWFVCGDNRKDAKDWIDRYDIGQKVAVVGTDWGASEARMLAILAQEQATISAAYDKAVIDAVLHVSIDTANMREHINRALFDPNVEGIHLDIDRPVEWGPEFDLAAALQPKAPVDRKDHKSYLAHDPTKSHKRGKRRRRK